MLLAVSGTGHRCQPVQYRQALPLLPQRGSCHRLTRQEHRRDGAVSFRWCGGRDGCPLAGAGDALRLSLRGHQHPSITGRVGTSWGWARDTSSRDMAFPSACPRGLSRGLHPRAPLTLLYPSLCRMSSPSNRRAAPRPAMLRAALAGMLGVLPRGGAAATPSAPQKSRRRGTRLPRAAPAHQGFQAATRPKPTVRRIVRERLSRQRVFSGKFTLAATGM
jgi:hypothetical protein